MIQRDSTQTITATRPANKRHIEFREPAQELFSIIRADLNNPIHCAATLALTRLFANDERHINLPKHPDLDHALIPSLKNNPAAHVFLAFDRLSPAGLCIGFTNFDALLASKTLYLNLLIVPETHRGKGIARRMLEHIEDRARKSLYKGITLEARGDNTLAVRLYHELGFKGPEYTSPVTSYGYFSKYL